MTEHQRLMLRRHLRRASQIYMSRSTELMSIPGTDEEVKCFVVTARVYEKLATEANDLMLKLT